MRPSSPVRGKMHPTVSIMVAYYNSERTVAATLDSLRRQTFRDWEAIVVDDGSSDGSAKIVERYAHKDRRIRLLSQPNQGLGAARNAGIRAAKGEFLNFLDADDILLPRMLDRTLRVLRHNPATGTVVSGWIYADPELRDLSWRVLPDPYRQVFPELAHANLFPCHALLTRRWLIEQAGFFDASLRHCHDWDLWVRVARCSPHFDRVEEPLVIYRMLPVSLSRNVHTFYRAGEEVIRRAHRPDDRVQQPLKEYAGGCACQAGDDRYFR